MIEDENNPETDDTPTTEDAAGTEPAAETTEAAEAASEEASGDGEKSKKQKISYENSLPRDEAVSYFEAIVSGLKKGHLEFRQEGGAVDMDLPDHLDVEVKASRSDKKGKISFEISWKNTGSPDLAIVSD